MGSPGEGGKNPAKAPHHLKLSLSIPFLDRIHFLTCQQGENLFSHLASPPRSLLGHTWHSPLNWQFGLSLHSQLPLLEGVGVEINTLFDASHEQAATNQPLKPLHTILLCTHPPL